MEPSELDDWAAEAAAEVGVALQPGDIAAVLELARDAAHGIARPAAPLTAFIAGMAVGRGQPTAEAMAALTDAIMRRAAVAGAAVDAGTRGPADLGAGGDSDSRGDGAPGSRGDGASGSRAGGGSDSRAGGASESGAGGASGTRAGGGPDSGARGGADVPAGGASDAAGRSAR